MNVYRKVMLPTSDAHWQAQVLRSLVACRGTHIPREVLLEYIDDLKKVFTQANYNLFHHNCNNFSNELATFLTGSGIPVGLSCLFSPA